MWSREVTLAFTGIKEDALWRMLKLFCEKKQDNKGQKGNLGRGSLTRVVGKREVKDSRQGRALPRNFIERLALTLKNEGLV